ncbi:MFS transporter [Agromyces intestinalis]|uniref:MFS transporter n=1 Tax=Agromyces intestinalis TaxID=2592652 RepID=A0A5C1YFH4_9MICO|nr:MFS transporter [Agromyces intestinalis]QEO13749.1 MFS transporter [Agromyces intestinalis]
MGVASYLTAATPPRLAVGGITVAIPVLAVEQTSDVALGGLLAAATLAPSILAAPIVGVLLDRARRPGALVAGAGIAMGAGYATAAFLGAVPTWVVALVLLVTGAAAPITMGGLSSFATEVIAEERRAYAVDALAYNLGSVVGPALVAASAALWSAQAATLVMAGCALAGAAGTVPLRLQPLATGVRGSMLQAMARGIRHIATHRPLAVVTSSGTLSQFGAGGLAIAAVLLSVQRTGDPGQGAVVVTAFAIGGLVGALWNAGHPSRLRSELVMGAGFAATGVLTIAAAADLGLWWTIAAIGASGLFTAPSASAMLLLRKQQSPPALRSQVFTVGAGLRAAAAAAGAAVAGIASGLGAGPLLVLIGVTWVASGAMLVAYPRGAPAIDGT